MFRRGVEPKQPPQAYEVKNKRMQERLIILIITAVILSSFYLGFAWNRYQDMSRVEAIKLAESLEALLPDSHIAELAAGAGNSQLPEYNLVKKRLVRLVENTSLIHYACLMGNQNGSIHVLVDSNTKDVSIYPSLENLKEDISELEWIPFESDRSVLTRPVTNPWGTWIRALVPVKDPASGKIIAMLGLSYSASEWHLNVCQRMIPDIIVTLSLLILLIALLRVLAEHAVLKEKSRQLAFNEALYRNLFEQAPIGITLNDCKKDVSWCQIRSINPAAKQILGGNTHDLSSIKWTEITHPDDLEEELMQFERFVNGEIEGYTIEKRILQPDGSSLWVNVKTSSFTDRAAAGFLYLCLFEDISARKAMEETLRESERSKSVLFSHIPGMAYRTRYDQQWTMEFASEGCRALTGYPPESLLHNRDLSYSDIIASEYRQLVWNEWQRILDQGESFVFEYEIITKSGERKWVLEMGQGVYDQNGSLKALEGIVFDISERKKRETQITYLTERDFLTGLYNRRYMEQEKNRLNRPEYWPLSIAICDINGLRMINGAYGHAKGDQLIIASAKLLQGCCRSSHVLGRVSGGEFMLLMPRTSSDESHKIVQEIQSMIEAFNRSKKPLPYDLSLSIGYSTVESFKQNINEALKTAEDYLNRRKLLNQSSSHHSILTSIMATLYAKSQETEEHGQRLGHYTGAIGEGLGLDEKSLDNLHLLSILHDIGKIGVDDSILNKPGKLTDEEWEQMKTHPEIGHRIAMSTPELEHIAEFILHHHERWDGMGYPFGLKGDEIPLLSRVLAVADAYDAMTEDRVYRDALSVQGALAEIKRCAGTQFDPAIAAVFIEILENKEIPDSGQVS